MKQLCDKISGFLKGIRQVTLSLFRFRTTLTEQKVVLVEIGGRGGPSFGWRLLKALDLLEVHGFEPDQFEAERLQKKNVFNRVYPSALGGKIGSQVLYLTSHPGCSSLLKPLPENFANSSIFRWLQVEKKVTVEVTTLDELATQPQWTAPTFLIIDIQGAERELLKEGKKALTSVLGIKIECRMRAMYEGEALLPELVTILEGEGFLFRDAKVVGSFDREAVEFDCLFVRQDEGLTESQKTLVRWWETMNQAPKSRPAA